MLSFNNKPLRLAIYFGLTLTAVAVLYAIWVVVVAATQGVKMPGYVTLIAAIVGLGGIQMVMLGVIGEYIGRIYYETKQRPHYLVKESNATPPGVVIGGAATSIYKLESQEQTRLDRAD